MRGAATRRTSSVHGLPHRVNSQFWLGGDERQRGGRWAGVILEARGISALLSGNDDGADADAGLACPARTADDSYVYAWSSASNACESDAPRVHLLVRARARRARKNAAESATSRAASLHGGCFVARCTIPGLMDICEPTPTRQRRDAAAPSGGGRGGGRAAARGRKRGAGAPANSSRLARR